MTRFRTMLVVLGVLALLAAGWVFTQQRAVPAPYRYEPAPVASAEPATAEAGGDADWQLMRVVATDTQAVLAEFPVASTAQGPVRMDWRAQVDDPLLQLSAPLDEVRQLATVLARHRGAGTPVLSWWDTGRQLQVLGAADIVFNQHLAEPLFVPSRWSGQRDAVMRTERAFWGQAGAEQHERFETFSRALVAPEDDGVRQLRTLTGERKAVLVLHLRDMLLLGQMHPRALAVGFQDFADSGDVHRSVRGVHGWLREGDHEAYAVMKLPDKLLRVIALNDEASSDTLAARLLPFIGNRQEDVAGLTLVWQGGGFVVFELDADAGGQAAGAPMPTAATGAGTG